MGPQPDQVRVQAFRKNIMRHFVESITFMRLIDLIKRMVI
jgi:hypothetical protein